MAIYDSAWCLDQFNIYTGRSASSDSITDANKYLRLAAGQSRVIAEMSFRCPDSLRPHATTLPTMTSVASGNIWTFGTDGDGYAIAPFGKARIFPNQASFPDYPWVEGVDYVNEGTQIRLTNQRTWATQLYWYGITLPAALSGSVQPVLFPEPSRELIVYEAVRQYGLEGKRDVDLATTMWGLLWAGGAAAYPRWFAVWKTQFASGGALGSLSGLQLAIGGVGTNGGSFSSP